MESENNKQEEHLGSNLLWTAPEADLGGSLFLIHSDYIDIDFDKVETLEDVKNILKALNIRISTQSTNYHELIKYLKK